MIRLFCDPVSICLKKLGGLHSYCLPCARRIKLGSLKTAESLSAPFVQPTRFVRVLVSEIEGHLPPFHR